jgi:hypothetical protein
MSGNVQMLEAPPRGRVAQAGEVDWRGDECTVGRTGPTAQP